MRSRRLHSGGHQPQRVKARQQPRAEQLNRRLAPRRRLRHSSAPWPRLLWSEPASWVAIGRELAGRGVDVIVYERSGIGAWASGVQPGGVRQQWGTPIACRLVRESAAFYADARRAARGTGAARLPRMRLPLRRAQRRGARASRRERSRAARGGGAVADGDVRGGCRPRARAARRRDRRRVLVRCGRVLRAAAEGCRGVRAGTRHPDPVGRLARTAPRRRRRRRGRRGHARAAPSCRSSSRTASSS